MLDNDFIDFVTTLFPSINPYTQDQAKRSMEQFYTKGQTFSCFNSRKLGGICQGDIIDEITFLKINETGDVLQYTGQGIVLSNSCDIENDDYIILAPFYPITATGFSPSKIEALKKNQLYGFMYFPDMSEPDIYADFSQIQSFPKKILKDKKRLYSLNLIGFYLLICKLTIHFLRPEDTEVQKSRQRLDFILSTPSLTC